MSIILSDMVEGLPDLLEIRRGTSEVRVTQISPPNQFKNGSIVFLSDLRQINSLVDLLKEQSPSALVIPKSSESRVEELPGTFAVILSPNVKLAMARVAKAYFPHPLAKLSHTQKVHPLAVIDPTAVIGQKVTIGPHAVIGPNVIVGDNVVIGPNTVVEAGVILGEGTHLHAQVYVAYDTQIGRHCEILPQSSIGSEGFGYATDSQGEHHRLTHFGRLILEDHVHVGSCVSIDRGTFSDSVIGAGTKIDNYCHLGHNIKTGKNCLITAGFISAGSAVLGDNNVMGGRTTVAGHITICDNVHAAGLSGIHNNVKNPGAYGGYPFVELKHFLKMQASLVHLPKMRRHLSQVMKKLGLTEDRD